MPATKPSSTGSQVPHGERASGVVSAGGWSKRTRTGFRVPSDASSTRHVWKVRPPLHGALHDASLLPSAKEAETGRAGRDRVGGHTEQQESEEAPTGPCRKRHAVRSLRPGRRTGPKPSSQALHEHRGGSGCHTQPGHTYDEGREPSARSVRRVVHGPGVDPVRGIPEIEQKADTGGQMDHAENDQDGPLLAFLAGLPDGLLREGGACSGGGLLVAACDGAEDRAFGLASA